MALGVLALVDHSWRDCANPVNQPRNVCTGYPGHTRAASPQVEQQPKHLYAAQARAS